MSNFWKSTLVIIAIFLAGCTTAKLAMKVDPILEANAFVYEIKSPGALSDKKLNVSFGPYRVVDIDTSWITTEESASGLFWVDLLYEFTGINSSGIQKSDDRTSDGKVSPASSIYDKRSESSQSLAYNFMVGSEVAWFSQCNHFIEMRESEYRNKTKVHLVLSSFTCLYTKAGSEPWVLSIDKRGYSKLEIKMSSSDELLIAHSTAGTLKLSDGSTPKMLRPAETGYTWTDGRNNIGAISLKVKPPRVWLDKRNSESMNEVLAMASTGLLIYQRKIEPTLER